MKTTIFYKAVIVCLLLINTGTLAWLWVQQGRQQGHEGRGNRADQLIIGRLHLNEAQQQQFEVLKHEHHGQMLDIQKESAEIHNVLFGLLKDSADNSSKKDSLITALAANDQRKETVTFEHFRKLRAILDVNQKADFDDLVEELGRQLMSGPPHDGPPPHP
ncbi:Spy/CpxP family protein refolding chaperone [Chitinophagaceae bacterium MMS25-I14]